MVKVSVAGKTLADFPDLVKQIDREKQPDLNPKDMKAGSSKKIWWKCPEGPDHEWETRTSHRTGAGSRCPYCYGEGVSVTNNLETTHPDIVKQWHPSKNGNKKQNQFRAGSKQKIVWTCDKGHEWNQTIRNRTKGSPACPYCSGNLINRENSFGSKFPKLLSEWDYEKNSGKDPYTIAPASGKKVWWKCPESPDHEWKSPIYSRTANKGGCPACAGQQVSITNSLASLYPKIAKEWHPSKNGNKKPNQVTRGTSKRYWWKCPEGPDHEWKASVGNRTSQKLGCPFCSNRKVSVTNSLENISPELSKEWHPTKNGNLTPAEVVAGGMKKVWWKCPKGPDHEWLGSIINRIRGRDCPYCRGLKVSVTNSIQILYSEISKYWHPTKNGDLTPTDVVAGSHTRIWFKCDNGPDHEWDSEVRVLTVRGGNCPFCSKNPKRLSVTNSLQTCYPEIAKELHPKKNGDLTPDKIIRGSNKKYWWLCANGHEWLTTANKRVRGRDCPQCQLVGISKIEIKIAFELYTIFDLDYIFRPKIKIENRTWLPDIMVESSKLVIEYDGHRFHGKEGLGSDEKIEIDKLKTEELTKEGWMVIRIREEPLEKITTNDLIIPQRNSAAYKDTVDEVLHKMIDLGIDVPGVQKYLESDRPIAKRAADEYIANLLREAEQETRNF